jgi:hypothetical protein
MSECQVRLIATSQVIVSGVFKKAKSAILSDTSGTEKSPAPQIIDIHMQAGTYSIDGRWSALDSESKHATGRDAVHRTQGIVLRLK